MREMKQHLHKKFIFSICKCRMLFSSLNENYDYIFKERKRKLSKIKSFLFVISIETTEKAIFANG